LTPVDRDALAFEVEGLFEFVLEGFGVLVVGVLPCL
jgi:hypothetical protein